jgi:hypothetical protein
MRVEPGVKDADDPDRSRLDKVIDRCAPFERNAAKAGAEIVARGAPIGEVGELVADFTDAPDVGGGSLGSSSFGHIGEDLLEV